MSQPHHTGGVIPAGTSLQIADSPDLEVSVTLNEFNNLTLCVEASDKPGINVNFTYEIAQEIAGNVFATLRRLAKPT